VVVGHLYDRAGSYEPRLIVFLALVAFGAAAVSLLLRSDGKGSAAGREGIVGSTIALQEE
jgi:hypothetical protein